MLFTRKKLEENEHATLASYAAFASKSRGRKYTESESEYRTAFQKDRDRVIHTSAFRRLEYKTQVFVNYQGDYYRTRLTHTLEVAQVAKAISRALGLNEDLAETIALAHDLGHPPFGHAGEEALNKLAKGAGGFDHNKQAIRVVTKIEKRYSSFPGLNLTWETLEGIMKHEIDAEVAGKEWEPDLQPTLEAQIVDLSDGIAYNAHDLDDGLRSKHLTPEQTAELPLLAELMHKLNIKPSDLYISQRRYLLVRELLGTMIQDAIFATEAALGKTSIETLIDVRQAESKLACLSTAMNQKTKELRKFLYQSLYFHYKQIRMARKAEHILEGMFHAYINSPDMLPFEAQKNAEDIGLIRAVTDYLAGMTDRFAGDEYKRLFDPNELT